MKKKISQLASIILSLMMLATMFAPQASTFAEDTTAADTGIVSEETQTEPESLTEAATDPAAEQETQAPAKEAASAPAKEQPQPKAKTPAAKTEKAKEQPKADAGKNDQKQEAAGKKAKDKKPYASGVTEEALNALDFTSMRLIVRTDNTQIFPDPGVVIASNGNVHLLQFTTEEDAQEAYGYFLKKADSVEVDAGIAIASEEAVAAEGEELMTAEENPIAEMQEALPEVAKAACDIALIDTGAAGADDAVSVLGEDTADDNGHGTRMLETMKEQAPNAKVLSIKALDAAGQGSISEVYAALQAAMAANVKIINLSLSFFMPGLAFTDLLRHFRRFAI